MAVGSIRHGFSGAPFRCFKGLCCNEKNRLAGFVGKTKNVDKVLKVAKSAVDVASGAADIKGEENKTVKNISGAVGGARDVLSLFNVFNGMVPATVQATRKCCKAIKRIFTSEEKSDAALEAAQQGCKVVSGVTSIPVFGGIKPVLLANKLAEKPFLSNQVKNNLGTAVNVLMTANHAAGFVGNVVSIHQEQKAFEKQLLEVNSLSEKGISNVQGSPWSPSAKSAIAALFSREAAAKRSEIRKAYFARMKHLFLGLLEKAFDLVGDVFKLIPLGISAGVRLIVTSVCSLVSACIGVYSAWSAS